MKKSLTFLIFVLTLSSCGFREKLDKETALSVLSEQNIYPKTLNEDIYIADPADARRLLDAGLESEGLITVQRTQKLIEIGEPLISFTEKAEPYLLVRNSDKIQQIKIADEEINQVTSVQMIEGEGRAVVEYTTTFKNISPFSKLSKQDLDKGSVHKVDFVLDDDGWKIETLPH